ncbi:FAD:protein FMN transferase [Teredinibacter waterburyi]|uniref:FAD:protein FMN transferase n=1 Tax=Teredinibacter waterburyi TaxID=1500538 RepID=UPI001CAA86FE|nr:FAD:protein FMN transferase [Teredinibacter waterburyi]
MMTGTFTLHSQGQGTSIKFNAMASPCELLIDTKDPSLVQQLATLATNQVRRIENTYSRYRDDNLCHRINTSQGHPVTIDNECFQLLCYADQCFQLSDGMFDISSGILRRAWRFDGSDKIPSQTDIDTLLPYIGWQKVEFGESFIKLPLGMEIDFGGIGKEFAVSLVAQKCRESAPETSVVVNFGGDIEISRPKHDLSPWMIGIEKPDSENEAEQLIKIAAGALATSGDARRFLLYKGVRYSHVLNPKTGWPIIDAPRSVTVAASQCIQAGSLATIALLHGNRAEEFLKAQNVPYWCSHANSIN